MPLRLVLRAMFNLAVLVRADGYVGAFHYIGTGCDVTDLLSVNREVYRKLCERGDLPSESGSSFLCPNPFLRDEARSE